MTKLTREQIAVIAEETAARKAEGVPGWQMREEKAQRDDIVDRVHARVQTVMEVENMTPAERAAYVIGKEDEVESLKEIIRQLRLDPLTGLHVRGHYEDSVPKLIQHRIEQNDLSESREGAEEESSEISMLIIDLDFFKRVNDTYGHPAGDFVLGEAGKIILKLFRERDIKARYGGDELAVVMPGCSLKKAHERAELLWKTIEKHEFVFHPKNAMPINIGPVTVSIGVGSIDSQKEQGTPDELKALLEKRTDALVYAAKDLGRNCVAAQDGFDMEDLYARQAEDARKKKEAEARDLPAATATATESASGEPAGESASTTPGA